MKKTLRVTVKHNPAELHQALDSIGVPVVAIRSDWTESERDVPLCSVIVFEDGYDPTVPAEAARISAKLAEAALTAKVAGKAVPSDPPGYDREASFLRNETL